MNIFRRSITGITSVYERFIKLNRLVRISMGLIFAHWFVLQMFVYFYAPIIRNDTITHVTVDTVTSLLSHPIYMLHPACAVLVYSMNKCTELLISAWYVTAVKTVDIIRKFVGGGFERFNNGLDVSVS